VLDQQPWIISWVVKKKKVKKGDLRFRQNHLSISKDDPRI